MVGRSIFLAVFSISGIAVAHGSMHRERPGHGAERAITLRAGKAQLELPSVQRRLLGAGHELAPEKAWTLGLASTKIFDDGLLLGLGGSYTRGDDWAVADGLLSARVGELHALVGGAPIQTRRWLVAPALVLGAYRATVDFSDTVALRSAGLVDGKESGFMLGAELGIDRRFPWRRHDGFTSVGLRLSLMEAVTPWRRDAFEPALLPRTAFVAIAIGLGRYARTE